MVRYLPVKEIDFEDIKNNGFGDKRLFIQFDESSSLEHYVISETSFVTLFCDEMFAFDEEGTMILRCEKDIIKFMFAF